MLINILFVILVIINSVVLVISLYNFLTITYLLPVNKSGQADEPKISVLIPVRDEEDSISSLVNSLKNLSYSNFEVLIYDDHSTDQTISVIEKAVNKDKRVSIVKGRQENPDYIGKNFALNQLSKRAKGDYLLFVDSDVQLTPIALNSILKVIRDDKSAAVSIFPTQAKIEGLERVFMPFFREGVSLMTVPFAKVTSSKREVEFIANGQLFMIHRAVYKEVGGHESVKDKYLDDVALMMEVRHKGLRVSVAIGNGIVTSDSYSSLSKAYKGVSKNIVLSYVSDINHHVSLTMVMMLVFFVQFFMVFVHPIFFFNLILIFIARVIVAKIYGHNQLKELLVTPIQILIYPFLLFGALDKLNKGVLIWKGRRIFLRRN